MKMKPFVFFYKQSGSITCGIDPWFRLLLDWRSAEDGITLIKPRFRIIGYAKPVR